MQKNILNIENFEDRYSKYINKDNFFGFPMQEIIDAEEKLKSTRNKSIAYFSMEYGLGENIHIESSSEQTEHKIFSNMRAMDYYNRLRLKENTDLPIYSGGLGVLAGDTVKTAADMKVSFVAVGVLWNKGYFKQNFWFRYGQVPEAMNWNPQNYPCLIPLNNRIKITNKEEDIYLRLWKYYVFSQDKKFVVPLILLDSNIKENREGVRHLTDQLYRSDDIWWRIMQRLILGVGGIRALQELGYNIDFHHLNEGHAAFAFVEKAKDLSGKDIDTLKNTFGYTCHTPVQAGHDRFTFRDLDYFILTEQMSVVKKFGVDPVDNNLANLTILCMNTCKNMNAVSKKHAQIMKIQFPEYKDKINAITNGIHINTWISEEFADVFDKYVEKTGDWRKDPTFLAKTAEQRYNRDYRVDIWQAHQRNKTKLCSNLKNWYFDENVITICWARRIAAYKRPALLFYDTERLVKIAKEIGPIQILYAGKSHPADNLGFTYINEILDKIDALEKHKDYLRVVMLENYDTCFAKLLTSSVDVWLNNPLPPFEASGTSGMKAILNGVIQISTFDGWVAETKGNDMGQIFGYRHSGDSIGDEYDLRLEEDSAELYNALEKIVSLYYQTNRNGKVNIHSEWLDMMITCLAESGYFNTYRMCSDYAEKIWEI